MEKQFNVGDRVVITGHSSAFKFSKGVVTEKRYPANTNLEPMYGVVVDGKYGERHEDIWMLPHELELSQLQSDLRGHGH